MKRSRVRVPVAPPNLVPVARRVLNLIELLSIRFLPKVQVKNASGILQGNLSDFDFKQSMKVAGLPKVGGVPVAPPHKKPYRKIGFFIIHEVVFLAAHRG